MTKDVRVLELPLSGEERHILRYYMLLNEVDSFQEAVRRLIREEGHRLDAPLPKPKPAGGDDAIEF